MRAQVGEANLSLDHQKQLQRTRKQKTTTPHLQTEDKEDCNSYPNV